MTSELPLRHAGFDASVFDPKDDHLNRWPLARQIYNVAVNGPAEWSARIGVYGEWGTGKLGSSLCRPWPRQMGHRGVV